MASNRLSRNLVALAASAITAVYAAGYVHTQAADASLGAPDPAPSATTAPAAAQPPAVVARTNPAPTPTARQTTSSRSSEESESSTSRSSPAQTAPAQSAPARTQSAPSQSAAAQSGPTLKDGTYSGVGMSRRGGIQVSLTVQGGRISAVNITGSSTEYPTRDIASLPGEVVSRQSAQVDVVGGATYSSQAFRGAVQQALQRAQA